MNREKATLIVEETFEKLYLELINEEQSKKCNIIKRTIFFNRIVKFLMIFITIFSLFITIIVSLNLMYTTYDVINSILYLGLFLFYLTIIIIFLFSTLLLILHIYDVEINKLPSGKYYFNGMDKYLDESNGKVACVNVKYYKGTRNSYNAIYNRYMNFVLVYFIVSCFAIFLVGILVNKLQLSNYDYVIYAKSFFVILCSILIIVNLTQLLILKLKNKSILNLHLKQGFNYNYLHIDVKEKLYPLIRPNFFEKVQVMIEIIEDEGEKKFIDESNYIQFLGEVVECLPYELIYLNNKYSCLAFSKYFSYNKMLSKSLDLCVESLARLDEKVLYNLRKVDVDSILGVEDNDIINGTLETYGNYKDTMGNTMLNSILIHKEYIDVGCDNYVRGVYVDKNSFLPKLKGVGSKFKVVFHSVLETIFNRITGRYQVQISNSSNEHMNYFQTFASKGKLYGFTNYNSSYFYTNILNNIKSTECEAKYFQFVLHDKNEIIVKDDYYVCNGNLREQLFYNNKLIISEKVLEVIKDYVEYESIKVKYNNDFYNYYICKPIKMSKRVINEKYSVYIEEIGSSLIKNSCLVEPYFYVKEAEKLKLFGVKSKRIIDYSLNNNFEYSYVFLTEELYKKLREFEGVRITDVSRNKKANSNETTTSLNTEIDYTIDMSNYKSSIFKMVKINDNRTYTSDILKKYKSYNLKTLANIFMYVLLCIVVIVFINNIPMDILYTSAAQTAELNTVYIFRILYLLLPFLFIKIYWYVRRLIISPTATIEDNSVVHTVRAIPIIGNKIRESHRIYDGELSMAFHNNKVMFELPIENKHSYIENEIYYNNTSFALNGVEVDMEKALQVGEGFVHELNHIYYLSNQKWKDLKIKPK